ncbi:glycosyltransferase family protein 47 [Actinidia rufa]|uniref:Glycosyltransferase family protein 47 n=1 Tax=Actinidia rufa TaxID=165716 RepID=A0A7J0GLP3_9ERIC|nr:glycosyltransferase family protein 47 [Actinidia rufa]
METRNGGRPFVHNGSLYRVGQDCGDTYGKQLRLFRVEVLTKDEFKEVEVPMGLEEPKKGRNSWNGARYHHLDVRQLNSGQWIGIMDGTESLQETQFVAVKCIVPLSWFPHNRGKRSDAFLDWERPNLVSSKLRQHCSRLNRACSSLRGIVKKNTCVGNLVLAFIFSVGVVLICSGVGNIYGGNSAYELYPLNGHYSQFTMLTMTYDARLWNLKMYVKHYSTCSSVLEIVVVWNKGKPPGLSEFDSAVPVSIRVEEKNSLNNRFKIDPKIKTRAVLELDDDILMTCDDVERGEKHGRRHNGYNVILTGAAFMDSWAAFPRYWSDKAKAGREVVDKNFTCEDVLLTYLYANSSSSDTVEYVRPAWAIDTSKLSGVAISKNPDEHYRIRSNCLTKFAEMYGSLTNRKSEFNRRKDGWDV